MSDEQIKRDGAVVATYAQHEDASSRGRRCLSHCKRFWWIYLVVLVLAVLLAVLLV